MASEVKTNKVSPATSTTLNVGDSGDTLALAVDSVTGFNVGSDAAGDVLYNDGTDYTRLAKPGTPADEVLTFATGASAPSWAAAAGGNNTPMFSAYLSSSQTLTDATFTKIQFDTITITDGGTYDNTTNYRWTPGTVGTYVIKTNLGYDYPGGNYCDIADANVRFYLNGAVFSPGFSFENHYISVVQNNPPGAVQLQYDAVISMNATDYLEVYGYMNHVFTAYTNYVTGNRSTYFSAFKLIGS